MMATMNIFLLDPMRGWVEDQVGCGLYSNARDWVSDLIRYKNVPGLWQ